PSVIDGPLALALAHDPTGRGDALARLPQRLHLRGEVRLVAPRGLVAAAVDLLEPPHAAHRRALDRGERGATAAVVGVERDVQADALGADPAQRVGERDRV